MISHFIGFFLILVLVTFKYIRKHKRDNYNNKNVTKKLLQAPEAPGAWPFIGHLHLLRGQVPLARTLGHMADKFGPIFRLRLGSHPAIVVSNWEMMRDCFTTNDIVFSTRPSTALGQYIGYNEAVFALAPYGSYWREVRKLVTLELLTSTRLEKLKHVRASEIEFCIRNLYSICKENNNKPTRVTLNECFEHITLNMMLKMLVGKRFSSFAKHIKEVVTRALYLGGVFVVSDSIPWLKWMDIGGHIKSMKRTSKEIDEIIGTWLQEHKKKKKINNNGDEADFMDVMLSTLPEDTLISGHDRDKIIKATTLILILTGSESTAETLIWTMSLLLNNSHTMKKAQQEIDNIVGKQRWVEESDINNLSYLQAVVRETLRLYPPGPLGGPRIATDDCHVGGYHVPRGTRLILNLLKLHRDPRVWARPNEFVPERWLENDASSQSLKAQVRSFEYGPFSFGRRMCPASGFALQVVHLTLARMIQAFDIATPHCAAVDMSEGLGIALPKLQPLHVLLTPRSPHTLSPTTYV